MKFINIDKSNWTIIVLVVLCLFHLITNIVWINLNTAPLPWDQAGHTVTAFKFYKHIVGVTNESFLSLSDRYPPLVYIIVGLAMSIFGQNSIIGSFMTTVFFVIAIVMLYLYIIERYHNKLLALTAAFLFSLLPPIYSNSRWLLLDIPLLAFLLATFYFLEKANFFTQRKYVIYSGIFTGLSLLIKQQAVVYLGLYLLFLFVSKFKLTFIKENIKKFKTNILLYIGIVLLLITPWYLANIQEIVQFATFFSKGESSDPRGLFTKENLLYYWQILINFQLTWFGFVVFAIAVVISLLRKKMLLNIFFIISILLAFTFIQNKDLRYTLPVLPFAILVIVYPLFTQVKKNITIKIYKTLFLILTIYYAVYFFSLSFGLPFDPEKVDYQRAVNLPIVGWVDYINLGANTSKYLAPKYNPNKYPQTAIINDIYNHLKQGRPNILVLVDKEYMNPANLQVTAYGMKYGFLRFESPYGIASFERYDELEKYISYFDMVLIAKNSFGQEDVMRHKIALEQLREYIQKNSSKLDLINTYSLPERDSIILYKLNI